MGTCVIGREIVSSNTLITSGLKDMPFVFYNLLARGADYERRTGWLLS